jgi:DNA polymerase I-like protein with 3'-5' exonuclease and polymerase domains
MSAPPLVCTLDFETRAIGPRPSDYPPRPVGLAIRWPGGISEYLAWGHPGYENNCTEEEAKRAWIKATREWQCLFHNGAFDLEVAATHWGVPWPRVWHDTLFLLFLTDPHAPSFSLKPSAERVLGIKPDEQDAVRDWILANVPGSTRKNFGAYISLAPVALVGPYAIGDVDRTHALFERLYPQVMETQPDAYAREIRLCPHLLQAEKNGIRVDRPLLEAWHDALEPTLVRCDALISTRLNCPVNVDSNDELVEALDRAGVMRAWEYTDGTVVALNGQLSVEGYEPNPFTSESVESPETPDPKKRSVSKGALRRWCTDTELVDTLLYRNVAATMLRTFVDPWLQSSMIDGRLHTKWHQVRGQEKNGTRTGRIASAEPNLANVINAQDVTPPLGCPFLPSLRQALLPEEGHVWVSADYSQQELRWSAHFEDGLMMRAYINDPRLDLHQYASDLIKQYTALTVPRKATKTVAFANIYGAGIKEVARQLGCTEEEAYGIQEAYFKAVPGLRVLAKKVKEKARIFGYVRSGGGRIIKVETPKLVKGRMRSFDYKLLNHLVQGTSADQTKEAIINFSMQATSGRLMTTVYDEINISVPRDDLGPVANALSDAMRNALPCDVPHLVDVEVGKSWGSLVEVQPGSAAKYILEKVDAL